MNSNSAAGIRSKRYVKKFRFVGITSILFTVFAILGFSSAIFTTPQVALAAVCGATGNVSGTVFKDYNNNGVQDVGEPAIENVTVSAYGTSSTPLASCESTAAGAYALDVTAGSDIRLEFTLPIDGSMDYLKPAAAGSDNSSTVQFLSVPATGSVTANAAFLDPAEFCQANPELALSCFSYGPLNDVNTPQDAIFTFPYDVAPPTVVLNTPVTPMPHTTIGQFSDLGAIYGMAYQRTTNTLYGAAWVKRHVELGPDGIAAIYQLDLDTNTTSLFVDLDSLVPGLFGAAPDRSVVDPVAPLFHDEDAYLKTGTTGIGDIEITPDDQSLAVVNMFSKQLHLIPAAPGTAVAAGDITTVAIPNTCSDAADARPMGLGYQKGKLYVGVVCSAESIANDLTVTNDITFTQSAQFDTIFGTEFKAEVFEFDLNSNSFNSAPVLSLPLNYSRGCIYAAGQTPADTQSGCLNDDVGWRPWQSDWQEVYSTNASGGILNSGAGNPIEYPQPILADIEFDEGDMILGFRDINGDRTGSQLGSPSPTTAAPGFPLTQTFRGAGMGDMLRACADASGNFVLEDNGSCGGVTTVGADNGQGPGVILSGGSFVLAGSGEYYWNDQAPGGANTIAVYDGNPFTSRNSVHDQTILGGLVQVPGLDVVTTMNEISNFYNAGIVWFNNETGASSKRQLAYPSVLDDPTAGGFPGKGNGLGDLEAFCNAAPIEIGNLVWDDANGNGVQDPGELPLPGVTVELVIGATTFSAETDTNGNFLFSSDPNGTNTTSAIYGLSIEPATEYTLRVPLGQAALGGLDVSPGNTNTGANADIRDSDGIGDGTASEIVFTTGPVGSNDHTLDFGFTNQQPADRGDLPDSYGTSLGANGPAHILVDDTRLGSCVDGDADGWPTADATGDDVEDTGGLDGSGTCITAGDDEDGVAFDTVLDSDVAGVICTTFDINLVGYIPPGAQEGVLNLWVDLNVDGDFDTGEQVVTDNVVDGTLAVADTLQFPAPTPGSIFGLQTVRQINDVFIPCDAALIDGNMGIRMRFTSGFGQGGDSPTGVANNGEVEDYLLPIYGWDLGDAPECDNSSGFACNQTTVGTLTNYKENVTEQTNGARHVVLDGGPILGSVVDAELDGVPDVQSGVNNAGDGTDEDGFLGVVGNGDGTFESWGNGNGGSIRVQTSSVDPTLGACLYGWMDWDNNGFGVGSNDPVSIAFVQSDGESVMSFSDPGVFDGQAPNKEVYLRLRVVPGDGDAASCTPSLYDPTAPGLNPGAVGAALGGEVEDYYLQFTPTAVTIRRIDTVDPKSTAMLIGFLGLLILSAAGLFLFNRRLRTG